MFLAKKRKQNKCRDGLKAESLEGLSSRRDAWRGTDCLGLVFVEKPLSFSVELGHPYGRLLKVNISDMIRKEEAVRRIVGGVVVIVRL